MKRVLLALWLLGVASLASAQTVSIRVTDRSTGANVPIGDDANDAARVNVVAGLSTLEGYMDGLEWFVDGLETLLGTTNTTLSTISSSVDGLETLLGTTNTTLSTISSSVDGIEGLLTTIDADTSALVLQTFDYDTGAGTDTTVMLGLALPASGGAVPVGSTNPLPISDNGGSITIDGSVSCSNCSGSGASDVDDSSFTLGTDSVAPAGFLFDDVTPDSVDEGDTGLARMSGNRVQYQIIRDGAAGAERGASVTANNELLVELGAGSASIGVLGANSGVDIGDVTINNASGASAVNIQDGGNSITVDGSVTADTELGAATLAADNLSLPTAPWVLAAMMCYDGATMDLCRSASVLEDAASANGDAGSILFAIRDDTLDARSGTEGNFEYLHTNANGALWAIDVNSAAILTALQLIDNPVLVDDAAFTPATSSVMMAGFEYDDTTPDTVNEGDAGAARMSARREVYTQLRDAAGNERGANVNASNELLVALSSVPSHAVTNAGTFAVQESGGALTALQLLDDVVIADDAAFTVATTKLSAAGFLIDESSTDSGDEGDLVATRVTPDRVLWAAPGAVASTSQGVTTHYLASAASTNATSVKASAGNVYGVRFVNTTATMYYLRMYNLSTSPTCSSSTGFVETIPVPASTSGNGIVALSAVPQAYTTGIAYCFTGGASSTDNTSAATGVYGSIFYK